MPPIDELTILVPVDISVADPPGLDIIDHLEPLEVVLLGYFPVPDQAEPALIKDEYEDEAESRLVAIAEGRPDLTEVLVFTHDREATIDRVADQYGCDAVLAPGAVTDIGRVLVPIRGDVNLDRIISVTARLIEASDATVTLFHSVSADADESYGEFLLRGATERLEEFGIDEDRVDWELSEGGNPSQEIIDLGNEFDIVVLGESEPSLVDRIIGDVLSRIVDDLESPALIVRDTE
ncbi:universal stress protein [Halomicroarcula sp. GCM10025324]|uniref:universal stress protein n=1 Tax=Haloarcula TaxID=2237 RepID=UPI0023E7EC15|nr:universal stress protein [Halomicroarcula sp. ZS-22-S1]